MPAFLRDLAIGQLDGMSYLGQDQAGQATAFPAFVWEAIGPVVPGAYRVYGYFPAGHGTGEASYSVESISQDGGAKRVC